LWFLFVSLNNSSAAKCIMASIPYLRAALTKGPSSHTFPTTSGTPGREEREHVLVLNCQQQLPHASYWGVLERYGNPRSQHH